MITLKKLQYIITIALQHIKSVWKCNDWMINIHLFNWRVPTYQALSYNINYDSELSKLGINQAESELFNYNLFYFKFKFRLR